MYDKLDSVGVAKKSVSSERRKHMDIKLHSLHEEMLSNYKINFFLLFRAVK